MNTLYTDIKKAFDSVNHRLLIKVLLFYGTNNQLVDWIENFLTNRFQQVCINASVSPPPSGAEWSTSGERNEYLSFSSVCDRM